jgi:signal peptidase I
VSGRLAIQGYKKYRMDEQPFQPKQRTLSPALAFFSALFGLGVGFVYVGELGLAVASIFCLYGLIAIAGWTGAMTSSVVGLWCVFILCLGIFAASAIWPAAIAFRHRNRVAKGYNRWWFYLLWLLMACVISIVAYKSRGVMFGYDLYRAPSVAMSPTIERDDFFLVDAWRYHRHTPTDGEIVVLTLNDGTGIKYVKRIVGIPGDRIELRDSTLFRNGQPVREPYVHPVAAFPSYGRDFGPVVIGPSQVFVLGDYRDNSVDSRKWGVIPIGLIQGRAQFIWLSFAQGHWQASRIGIDLRPKG